MPEMTKKNHLELTNVEDLRPILKARMEELGWSTYKLGKLATEVGITKSATYRFLRGEYNITWHRAVKLLQIVGIDVVLKPKPEDKVT